MTPEQMGLEELQGLAKRLTAVVINEADPAHWPGGLTPVQNLSRDDLQARTNVKKSATLTVGLLQKVSDLIASKTDVKNPVTAAQVQANEQSDLDREIAAAQREAEAIMNRITAKHGSSH